MCPSHLMRMCVIRARFIGATFPFTQSSSCKVHANPVLIVDLEFNVYIATGPKETTPGIKLGSRASQADALPIELASPKIHCIECDLILCHRLGH